MKPLVLSPLEKSLLTLIIAAVLLCYSIIGAAQDTYVGHLNFSRQSEIDSFLIQHPTCSAIDGSITLNNINNDIFNVSGFSNIEYISEDLRLLFQAQYFDLSGFIALDSIGDSLIMKELDWIYTNQTPVNIFQGFSGLQSLGHFVFDNGYLFDEPDLFPSLTECQTITFYKWGRHNLSFTNSFNNLITINSIRYLNENSGIWGNYFYVDYGEGNPMIGALGWYFSLTNSFNALEQAETLLFDNGFGYISNSFLSLESVHELNIGTDYSPYSQITTTPNCFENVSALHSLVMLSYVSTHITDSSTISFPLFQSLTHADNIYYEVQTELDLTASIFTNLFASLQSCESLLFSIYGSDADITFPQLQYINESYFSLEGGSYHLGFPRLQSTNQFGVLGGQLFCSIALDSLRQVGEGGLNFTDVDSLSLISLDSISGHLSIAYSNHSDLSFLGNLSFLQSAEFIANPNLSYCAIQAVCEKIQLNPEAITVSNNATGCSSIEEILAQCDAICPDTDLNGICDSVQTVYTGDLEFTSTSEVQTFANAFPQVHKIMGNLTLSGYTGDSLLDTEAFINLDTIQGQLQYDYSEGIAFSGFSNLRHVDSFIGAYPYYNYSITYNENDSTPVYSYCTNCFPSLISANKMYITSAEGNLVSSFNALEQCDTLNIDCSGLNGAFTNLNSCHFLNINTSLSASYPFDGDHCNEDPYHLLAMQLLPNEYACHSTISSSFNLLNSLDCFFATELEISQSFNNIEICRTMYFNNVVTSESLSNLNSCDNLFSWGNSSIIDCFENINSLNLVGIYSQEDSINFPQLQRINWGELRLIDNSIVNLNQLDTISTIVYFYSINGDVNANNISIQLPELDYAETLSISYLNLQQFEISSQYFCGFLSADNSNGLESLGNIYLTDRITVVNCPDFSNCNSIGICNYCSENPDSCFFQNNSPGCNTTQEVIIQCQGSTASGIVYYDVNCDQQFNNDDALVSYPILLQGDTLPIGSSGEAGYFFVPLELNSTTTLFAQHNSDWSSEGPITLTTSDSLQVFTDLQIGLCPMTIIHDVAVNVNASMDPRPGFTVRYNLVAQNLWPGSDSASVVFNTAQMPGAVITAYSSGGTLAGNQVSFTTDLLYGQSQTLWVDVLVPVGTPLGTAYTATAVIALNDAQAVDSHPENNNYTLAQTVIGSYDPNDKLVTPAVIDLLDIDSTQTATIEYTIRFQNTGTAEAFFVRVLDTLSQALNPATFELIATSHPSEITFHDNHTIEWFFDNIMLPDSFSNEPESHGFIQFRIQTLPLSEPFILENEAAIYFDFNEPVITPPAVTSVVICAEAGDVCDDGDACTIADVIQADCTCVGTFADNDNDGICDPLDNCQGVPFLLTPITDLNLTCASSIPSELPEFLMADNGPVTLSFTDSVITGNGCNVLIQRTFIAENACDNRVYVAQLISTSDNIAPTMFNCPTDTSIHCSELTDFIAQPFATDNCDENANITFTEECLNCTSDSTVLELFTPELPADNPCGYPYNWALALLNMSNAHRWYQIDTTINARMIDYHDGTARYSGRFVNVLNNNAGFDFDFRIGEGMNFEEWTNSHVSGFMADCGATADNHASWMYYILQSSPSAELIGWGDYEGSQLNITHAPLNEYFGFQVGEGANNYNDSYGAGVFMSYSGIFSVNSQFVQTTGAGDFRFTIQDTTLTSVIRTWTATDCAGNSSSCAQVITCINETIDPGCSPGQLCDDLDPCTINDLIQADCWCAGTFADNDNDGVCDAEDACDNNLAGTACDDLDPCTTGDIIQPDCSCAGIVTDSDNDGVCDAAEVAGCMDMDACNYDATATDDDGSCTYVESLSIQGNGNAVAGIEETYTYPGPASSAYQWSIDTGTIQSGQGTPAVSVIWSDALTGTLQVIETTATNCVGDTITLEVSVSPNAMDAWNAALFTLYPNPVSDILHVTGDIPSNGRLSIYNGIGQCVYSGLLQSTIDVHTLAAGVYHLQVEYVGTVQRKKFTIVRGE